MIRFGKILTVLTALGLAGCSGAPLGMDVARLSKVDPLTTDPVALRFAIELPANLQTVGGQIQVTGKLDFAPGLAGETYHIAFEQIPNGPAEQRLAQDVKPGHHILAFRIAPTDLADFQEFRGRALAADRGGSISVAAVPCRIGTQEPDKLPMAVYLLAAEITDYAGMFKNRDIRGKLGLTDPQEIARCKP